jgi:hypothetical protein
VFGSPSGLIAEPPSSLCLSVSVNSFISCAEASSLQCFLISLAPFVDELVSSELDSVSSSSLSLLSFDATGILLGTSSGSVSDIETANSLLRPFLFTIDSASQVHVLTGADALKLLVNPVPSNLEVVGVSGNSTRADLMGHLVVALQDPASGSFYYVDFGVAHGINSCPLNLLSLPLLFKAGAVAHFELGNCYFQVQPDAPRNPFQYSDDGMTALQIEVDSEVSPTTTSS